MIFPKDILIIGGNAAGPAAAAKAKRTSPDSNVIMFEAGNFISTGTCELPYVLSGEIINYNEIVFYNPEKFEKEKGVKVLANHLVENIDRSNKYVLVRNLLTQQSFKQNYDKLILTTGSRPKILPTLTPSLKNVFPFKNVGNLIDIQKYLNNNKVRNILVVGSGYIGLETVEALKGQGYNVILLDKEKLPMPDAEIEVRHLISDLFQKQGIEFYGGVANPKFNIRNDKVINVVLEGRTTEIDLVITAIGVEPNNDLAVGTKLEVGNSGGLKVNQKLQTSDSNIFAAGDNIELINKITNRNEFIPLATHAHQSGHIAGENAAGGNVRINPVVKNIAVKIFDKNLVSVGINSEKAHQHKFIFDSVSAVTPNLIKVMPASENVFGKVIFNKTTKQIIGACFYGGREVTGYGDLISSFISNKIPATELSKVNYNYTPPLSPFVNLLSILGRKILREK